MEYFSDDDEFPEDLEDVDYGNELEVASNQSDGE